MFFTQGKVTFNFGRIAHKLHFYETKQHEVLIIIFDTYMTNQQMRISKYVPSHIITLHQHVSVSHVAIIRVANNNNTTNKHILSCSE